MRTSTALLGVALLVTAATFLLGSILIWNIYKATYATPVVDKSTVFPSSVRPLRVALTRTPGGPSEWIVYAKVFARVQRDLGRPVVVYYGLSSSDELAMFRNKQLDVALVSTLDYFDVHDAGLVTPVAAPVVCSEPMDTAVVIVPVRSSISTVEDLRGTRFAVSRDLAGSAFPWWLLKKRGIDPKGFFAKTPADVQAENIRKLLAGEVDATSVRRSALATWPKGTLRVIAQSPDLGMPPVVASNHLDGATKSAVRRSLLAAVTQGIVPTSSVISGFRLTEESEYEFARVLDAVDRSAERDAFGIAHQ